MMFAKGVRTKDYRDVIAELVAQDIVRTEFHSGRFALKIITAVLSTHFRITLDAAEELLDKACARVIYEEADAQQIKMIDWVTVDMLVEARPHLHPIEAARLIDAARTEVERERREEEGNKKCPP